MSDILRRIITRFEAQPGNVRAVLGGVSSGYTQAAGSARTLAREQSYLNNQLRAFGTTMRYAIAGTAIFGAAGTISTLSQIQTQLGLISAIGSVSSPQGKGLLLVGDRLQNIGTQARQAAVDTVQPISAVNDAIVALLSTVSNVPENQVVPMVRQMAEVATLSQISVDDATKSYTAMQVAFNKPVNLQNIKKTAQEFFMMIRRVPGGPAVGGQIITQMGQLAQVSRGGRISQPELFGLLTAGLRTGIPPSQYGLGLQYMIQTMTRQRPLTKDAAAMMDQLGITPDFIATNPQGGMAALFRIIQRVQQAGGLTNVQASIRGLRTAEEQLGEEADIPKALLSGPGAKVASTIFRRVHEYRTFLALYGRATQARGGFEDPTLKQEIADMQAAEHGHVRDVENINKAWQRFKNQAKLPQAAIALQVLGQDVANVFAPILNLGARGITGLSSFATQHPDITRGVVLGGGLAALAYGGLRTFGKIGGRAVPALALAEGLGGAGGQWKGMPGESATHPSFVWVLGTMFGPGGMLGRGPTIFSGGGRGAAGPGGIAAGTTAATAGRWSRFLRGAGKVGAAGIVAYGASSIIDDWMNDAFGAGGKSMGAVNQAAMGKITAKQLPGGYALLHDEARRMGGRFKTNQWWIAGPDTHGYQQISSAQATAFSKALRQQEAGGKPIKLQGKADVEVTVNLKNQDGTTTKKKVKVPVELFQDFMDSPLKAPTSRGQSKTTRG